MILPFGRAKQTKSAVNRPYRFISSSYAHYALNATTPLRDELSALADGYFDNVPILEKSADEPHMAKYGGHPKDDGCEAWANALGAYMKELLKDCP
ncbi:MAG: hypothetical protein IJ428_06895 [Clostridia bacterium]|nr:hypothetical protein [Clostridia bacterium]